MCSGRSGRDQAGPRGPKERETMAKIKRSVILLLAAWCVVALALSAPPALGTGYYTTSVETDKAVYEVGEWATVTHTILSPSDSDEGAWLWFATTPGYDMFVYEDPGGLSPIELFLNREPVSNIANAQAQMEWEITLLPGESMERGGDGT